MSISVSRDPDLPLLEIRSVGYRDTLSFEERDGKVYICLGVTQIAMTKHEWRLTATALYNFAKE